MKHPIVSIFAHAIEESTSQRLAERFTVHVNASDVDYERKLAEQSPHVIVTVAEKWQDFPHLSQMSEGNHRWVHFASEQALLEGLDGIGHCFVKNAVTPPTTTPLISVFTAAFNSGSRILRAFESLLHQSYANWEWVVLDDASTDGRTFELLTELASRPDAGGRVRVFRNARRSGVIGDVKNNAAHLCRGEVLVELDHDDELLPDTLTWIESTFNACPEAKFVYTDFCEIDEATGEPIRYPPGWAMGFGSYYRQRRGDRWLSVASSPPVNAFTVRHIVGMPNHARAWRDEFYRAIGGHNPEFHVADDYELLLRTLCHGEMIHLPRLGYIQYRAANRSNQTIERNDQIQDLVRYLRNFYREQIDQHCTQLRETTQSAEGYWTHSESQASVSRRHDPASDDQDFPLVSVVMPTYDRPQLLKRALESALRQTYENLDVVVVGDCCPMLDELMDSVVDARVRYWNLERHEGSLGTAPRNYALKMLCRGELIAYLDDDNQWEPRHLETLVNLFHAQPTIAYAFSSYRMGDTPIIARQPRRYLIDTSALLHRRGLLDRYGYWRSKDEVGYAHDWELVSRWVSEPWACSAEPTLLYNIETSNMNVEFIEFARRLSEQTR